MRRATKSFFIAERTSSRALTPFVLRPALHGSLPSQLIAGAFCFHQSLAEFGVAYRPAAEFSPALYIRSTREEKHVPNDYVVLSAIVSLRALRGIYNILHNLVLWPWTRVFGASTLFLASLDSTAVADVATRTTGTLYGSKQHLYLGP